MDVRINLTIPELFADPLEKEMAAMQKREDAAAKKENREPRKITLQAAILALCGAKLGIKHEPLRRGRRWPQKEAVE